jgi:hypothetical protein
VAQQYLRKCSLIVGPASGAALDFADFRVTFQVRRGDLQNPNSADIRIYNLADNTANKIHDEFTQVVLQAGYADSFGLIFRGTIKQVRKGRVDAKDSYVDITAADGDEAYNFSTMALTLAANTQPVEGLQGMIQSLTKGALAQAPSQLPTLPANGRVRGRTYFGMTRDEMRDFARNYDFSWSFQDGRITLIPNTGYLPGTIPVISPRSGLIGVPEQTQNGISMRVLLNPNIKIGQLVKLDSSVNLFRFGLDLESQAQNAALTPTGLGALAQQIKTNNDGLYYVMVAEHSGDTRGNEWYTDIVCLSADATVTQESVPGGVPALPEGVVRRN